MTDTEVNIQFGISIILYDICSEVAEQVKQDTFSDRIMPQFVRACSKISEVRNPTAYLKLANQLLNSDLINELNSIHDTRCANND